MRKELGRGRKVKRELTRASDTLRQLLYYKTVAAQIKVKVFQ